MRTLATLFGADAGSTLALFSEAGLVVSLLVFVLIVWRTWSRRGRAGHDEASRLPLEDDDVHGRRASGGGLHR